MKLDVGLVAISGLVKSVSILGEIYSPDYILTVWQFLP